MKKIFLYLIIYSCITSISFSQNIHLRTKGLDSISQQFNKEINLQKTFKNTKELNLEIEKLQTTTSNQGYFNAFFEDLKKSNDSTYVLNFKLNNQFKKITIKHQNEIPDKELNTILTSDSKVNPNSFTLHVNELETNLNNIIKHLTNKGKTFSSAQLQNITITNNTVSADLNLYSSKTNNITEIKIKGYDKFPRKFLKHYLRIKPKQELNLDAIEKKSNNINALRFANELKKPEVLFSKDSTIVYLYTKKVKSNSFDGFLGFSSNPETSKIDFNGNINLQLINNLNSGEELHLKYRSTENDQQNINIKLRVPFIFNSPFSLEGELDIFKRDSSFTNNIQSIQTKYQLSNSIKIGGGARFTKSNSLNNLSTTNQDYNKTTFLVNIEHSKPNPYRLFLYKTRTFFEFGSTTRTTEVNKTNQQSLSLSTEYIFNLNKKNSFFLKNQSHYLISDDILENELHYIGGINSIRGFQENSIPSSLYSILNSEYRILLNQNLYLHSVLDYGITRNEISKEAENLIGFGLGFGLKTNNNLLQFIFANSKTDDENIKFSNSNIHLSLKTIF